MSQRAEVLRMPAAVIPDAGGEPATGRGTRLASALVNVIVAAFFSFFLVSAARFLMETGSPVGLGAVMCNTILVGCILTRREPVRVTASLRNRLVAPLTQLLPLLLRPVAGAAGWLALTSAAGQVAGLTLMTASLLALNRSIGILAANRGVKTSGPYAWVRHPLYAGEILFFVGFLLGNFTTGNALLVLLLVAGQLARIQHEEALLRADDDYRRYQDAVPHLLIPRLF